MNKRSYDIWNTCTNGKNGRVPEFAFTSFGAIINHISNQYNIFTIYRDASIYILDFGT